MTDQITVIRSDRKTVAVEIKRDLSVIVRAPRRMKQADIDRFVRKKTPWIEKHLAIAEARLAKAEPIQAFTANEIKALAKQARAEIPPRVDALAGKIGVTYGRITVRSQVSRWGSCSAKGDLSFNCLLMLCPDEVVEYVIIHELCHRKHMNHSAAFWACVEAHCPDCKAQKKWLKDHGSDLIGRLRAKG